MVQLTTQMFQMRKEMKFKGASGYRVNLITMPETQGSHFLLGQTWPLHPFVGDKNLMRELIYFLKFKAF